MIRHQQADDLYNQFADFEVSFAELSGLIADSNGGSEFNGQQSLHLFWQHLIQLNKGLYQLLSDVTNPVTANVSAPQPASMALEMDS
jgi:hypothetical protein